MTEPDYSINGCDFTRLCRAMAARVCAQGAISLFIKQQVIIAHYGDLIRHVQSALFFAVLFT